MLPFLAVIALFLVVHFQLAIREEVLIEAVPSSAVRHVPSHGSAKYTVSRGSASV